MLVMSRDDGYSAASLEMMVSAASLESPRDGG